jgi:hypothetical protein
MVYKLMHFQKLNLLICLTVMNIQKKKRSLARKLDTLSRR